MCEVLNILGPRLQITSLFSLVGRETMRRHAELRTDAYI